MENTPGTHAVRRATPADVSQVAAVISRAFHDDPPMRWVLPDDRSRPRILAAAAALLVRRVYLPQDECWTTGDHAAAALWELPDQWRLGVGRQLGLLPAMLRIHGRHLPRVVRATTTLERGHPREPHMYLPFVGVDPPRQGRGLGSRVLQPVYDRCDAEGLPAFLEASTERGRDLYLRHGFAVTEEFSLGRGCPPLWRMWRPARPHAA